MRLLAEVGANINVLERFGERPLAHAVMSLSPNGPACVKALAELGANVDATNRHGETAIMKCVERGCTTRNIKILAEFGANVDTPSKEGFTPILYAGIFASRRHD